MKNVNRQVDILIVGAGISGIGLAVHLLKNCPHHSFEILEKRASYGGTWDLFKYPGIRSDSDMTTFGYDFRPWTKTNVLADASSIKHYLSEVLTEFNIQEKIHYGFQVLAANYDSQKKKWYVNVLDNENNQQIWVVNFLLGCTGYYNYDHGFEPQFRGVDTFKGEFIHPQHWPDHLDYRNKKVVIIGSGATAITLVPAMVKGGAAHVTMLQRSPTYIASIPSKDLLYEKMRKYVSEEVAYKIARTRNILMQRAVYLLAQKKPQLLRKILIRSIEKKLENKVDIKHFTPDYSPWEQRLCVVPDGDLFQVLKNGQASVETDQIEQFTSSGIQLKSGKYLQADIVVSATGLDIQILGGIKISIDDEFVDLSKHMLYQGTMLSDIPNMAIIIGYINASWTLKVDISAEYICRLLNYMMNHDYQEVVAIGDSSQILSDTVMGSLSSGYIARAIDVLPKQGKTAPWYVSNHYLADRKALKKATFDDDILKFKS